MNSIRSKTILLTVCAIVVTMMIATLLGVTAVRNIGNSSSEQMLLLLCEAGEKNLDSYFEDVEKSVEIVSGIVETDLGQMASVDELGRHVARMRTVFEKTVSNTSGVLTYYYRIDPTVSHSEAGFWYVASGTDGFVEHEVTDISAYDLDDTSKLVWFTVPRATGQSVWLRPYITENLGAHVISYNVPVYWQKYFIGVVGIEIDYSTMAEQVNHIRLYSNGYAFINDVDGRIIYHPYLDTATLDDSSHPEIPQGLLSEDKLVRYYYYDVERLAVWLPLSNGMRLYVTVPVSEINGNWQALISEIILVSAIVLMIFILATMRLTGQITKPLQKLTEVAQQVDQGNYDCDLTYDENDEVGILTRTVSHLVAHLKTYISDLNDLAYADALTAVHNKGAFDIYIQNIEETLKATDRAGEFAIGIFDCNDLKKINDEFGHDKGNLYLKAACQVICEVFDHSPVFRIGGDEFAVVLQNLDYQNRDSLIGRFDEECANRRRQSSAPWEKVDVARGFAAYNPAADESANDVVRRADKLMYENKWICKHGSAEVK